ncbi:alpha/beta hydrolase fold protein, partial [Tanacetum coccineum]
ERIFKKKAKNDQANPSSIRGLSIQNLPATSFSLLLPYVNQLRELNLICTYVKGHCQCFLIERCPNLEVLRTDDVYGDMGLRVIDVALLDISNEAFECVGTHSNNLRKFRMFLFKKAGVDVDFALSLKGTRYSEKGQKQSKTDKNEPENGKSVKKSKSTSQKVSSQSQQVKAEYETKEKY